MSKAKKFPVLKIAVGIIVVICIVAAGFIIVKNKKKELAQTPLPTVLPLPVKTTMVRYGDVAQTQQYLGTLRARLNVLLAPRVMGQITEIRAHEGDHVRKGETLVVIDSRIQRARVNSLKAQLDAAKTALYTYQRIYQRDLYLFQNKGLSQEALDRSRMARDSARAQVTDLTNSLHSAQVELSYTRLKAPFDGIVTRQFMYVGDTALAGRPVLAIDAVNRGYKLTVNIPQDVFLLLKKGEAVQILPPQKGQNPVTAHISRLYPQPDTGSLPVCEIDLSSRPFDLPSGSTYTVNLTISKTKGLIVPTRSILHQAMGNDLVFVVDNQDRIKVVPVRVLTQTTDLSCVSCITPKALLPGDQIVIAGEDMLLRLHQGQQVHPALITRGR